MGIYLDTFDREKTVCGIDCICTMDKIENPTYYEFATTPNTFTSLEAICIETKEQIELKCNTLTGDVDPNTPCPQPTCKKTDIENKDFYMLKDEEGFAGVLTGVCTYGNHFELQCENQTIVYTKPCPTEPTCQDTMEGCDDITLDQCGNVNQTKWHQASLHCCKCGKKLWTFNEWSDCVLQENQTCGAGYKTAKFECPFDEALCGSRPYALTTCTVECTNEEEWKNRIGNDNSDDSSSGSPKPIEGIFIFEKEEDDCS